MKKLLLTALFLVNGVSLYALKNDDFVMVNVDDAKDDDFVMVEAIEPNAKEKAGIAARKALDDAKNKIKEEAEKAVNKQVDVFANKLNEWLEKELPSILEKAFTGIATKAHSGASSLWEGTKNRVSRGWGWLMGSSKKEAKPALINQIPVNALMEDLD